MHFFYIPAAFKAGKIPNGVDPRVTMITASALLCLGTFFVGPSNLLPDSLWLMAIGQAAHGFLIPFIMVPNYNEMVMSGDLTFPENEAAVRDLSSGALNMFMGLGQTIGPIFASILT